MTRMKFLNTQIDNITFDEALENVNKFVNSGQYNYIVTPNVDHIVQLEQNQNLRAAYKNAALVLTDGQPLIWIAKLLQQPITEKISGSDFFPAVAQLSAKKGYRVFLLGAAKGVAEVAKSKLEEKFPGLVISGVYSPPIGFEDSEKELKKIETIINESQTDILAVGLGAPKQEIFLYNCFINKALNVSLAMGIGATIDFEAGQIKRAPNWMSRNGLEWTYRLLKEPRRMYKRYWNDVKKIIPIVIKYRNKQ